VRPDAYTGNAAISGIPAAGTWRMFFHRTRFKFADTLRANELKRVRARGSASARECGHVGEFVSCIHMRIYAADKVVTVPMERI